METFDLSGNSENSFADMWRSLLCLSQETSCDMTKTSVLIPLYKSHIQKAIRRSKRWIAILTALTLMRVPLGTCQLRLSDRLEGLIQVLRRITVITIEDAALHFQYPVLSWLFAYCCRLQSRVLNNNNAVSTFCKRKWESIILFVLGYVDYLARLQIKDDSSPETALSEYGAFMRRSILHPKEGLTIQRILDSELSTQKKDLLISIFLRVNYGGSSGDLDMLVRSAGIWFNRFHIEEFPIEVQQSELELSERDYGFIIDRLRGKLQGEWPVLNESNVILAGADNHVFTSIPRQLSTMLRVEEAKELVRIEGNDLNTEESLIAAITSMIWLCSSSVTNKRIVSAVMSPEEANAPNHLKLAYDALWKKYQAPFENIAIKHLSKVFKK
jgi:hypothetical protein